MWNVYIPAASWVLILVVDPGATAFSFSRHTMITYGHMVSYDSHAMSPQIGVAL